MNHTDSSMILVTSHLNSCFAEEIRKFERSLESHQGGHDKRAKSHSTCDVECHTFYYRGTYFDLVVQCLWCTVADRIDELCNEHPNVQKITHLTSPAYSKKNLFLRPANEFTHCLSIMQSTAYDNVKTWKDQLTISYLTVVANSIHTTRMRSEMWIEPDYDWIWSWKIYFRCDDSSNKNLVGSTNRVMACGLFFVLDQLG